MGNELIFQMWGSSALLWPNKNIINNSVWLPVIGSGMKGKVVHYRDIFVHKWVHIVTF